jgi:hypothetical protein
MRRAIAGAIAVTHRKTVEMPHNDINTFLHKFINQTGHQGKDTFESALAKVLHHLHTINSETTTPQLRRNARQSLRRILAKQHGPRIMQKISAGGAQ